MNETTQATTKTITHANIKDARIIRTSYGPLKTDPAITKEVRNRVAIDNKTQMDNRTWQRMKTLPKFKMNHKIVKEIEEELKIKNKKKSTNKNLILMLILTGTALSTIAITMGIYKIHKKEEQMI